MSLLYSIAGAVLPSLLPGIFGGGGAPGAPSIQGFLASHATPSLGDAIRYFGPALGSQVWAQISSGGMAVDPGYAFATDRFRAEELYAGPYLPVPVPRFPLPPIRPPGFPPGYPPQFPRLPTFPIPTFPNGRRDRIPGLPELPRGPGGRLRIPGRRRRRRRKGISGSELRGFERVSRLLATYCAPARQFRRAAYRPRRRRRTWR